MSATNYCFRNNSRLTWNWAAPAAAASWPSSPRPRRQPVPCQDSPLSMCIAYSKCLVVCHVPSRGVGCHGSTPAGMLQSGGTELELRSGNSSV